MKVYTASAALLPEPMKLTLSEWLDGRAHSHEVYLHAPMAELFTRETGYPADWPTHTQAETLKTMANHPAGGQLKVADPKQLTCWGYEMARYLAGKYAGHECNKMGRGFIFYDCLDALRQKGL